MKKVFLFALCAAVSLVGLATVNVNAAPDMASWGSGDGKSQGGGHQHGHGKKGGGFSGGSNWGMSEGFMTARLRAVWSMDLNKDQKTKIRAIQRDLRAKHWDLEDKIELASDKIFDLYKTDTRDAKAIGKVYAEIFDYRRQIIELAIEAGNKVEAVLTNDQRMMLKKFRPKHKWGGGWSPKN